MLSRLAAWAQGCEREVRFLSVRVWGKASPAPRSILLPLPTNCLTPYEGSDKGPSDKPTNRETPMSVNFYCTDAPNVTVTCPYCAEVRAAGPALGHIWPHLDGHPAPSFDEDPDAMGDWTAADWARACCSTHCDGTTVESDAPELNLTNYNAMRVLRAARVADSDELMGELEGVELLEARETLADSLWGQPPHAVRRGARVLALLDYAVEEGLSVSWA